MIYQAVEKTIELAGSPMSYVAFGKGERTLVIIPGLSLRSIHGSAVPLAYMYRKFGKDYRVYVFDKKQDLPEGVTVRDLAEDLAAAMQSLGLGPADVMGVSQGGMIAQYLALDHPELVRKLVLAVTMSRPNDTVRDAVGYWVESLDGGDYSAIVKDMTVRMYSEAYVKKYQWMFPVLMKFTKLEDPKRFVRLAKACLTCDTYDRLPEIRCPVFVLGGAEDRIVTGRASLEMSERLGCPCHIYPGLGHSAYEEAKDFNDRVADFLHA